MKQKISYAITLLVMLMTMQASLMAQQYESVPNDPMKSRIYTLDNGLKVYLTVNKDQPRVQTYIAVRVGGKNDPAETTGLSHYLEHLMFKGTDSFGTSNFAAEKPLLDEIERQYEIYRTKTDAEERRAIYHVIDSLSYKASTYAIANEYDKLMAGIGAVGTNAYTSDDITCYTEDIPANQIENWARIQSDRFRNMVIRGFHTELEAVYEEYNISLTNDMRKVVEAAGQILFPNHPYGKQTVIGLGDHLKNPSITNIKNHFSKWYVPNNVAICMSGDIDFDTTLAIIKKYFGDWTPNPNVEAQRAELLNIPLRKLTAPVTKKIYGPEAEEMVLVWGFPGTRSKDFDYLEIISEILNNGKAGLFDIDLNQTQKVLASGCELNPMSDFSEMFALAIPSEGQTLDEAKTLMLEEMNKLKNGQFDDKLLESIINNMKLRRMRMLESNESRADMFVDAFVNGIEWKDEVEKIDRLSRITKADVVSFAQKYITDGYAEIYKLKDEDPNQKKIEKPAISPIEMNRDKTSEFVRSVLTSEVESIQPVFVDYDSDMSVHKFRNNNELLYRQNVDNSLFTLQYRINRGTKADRELDIAAGYITYLGTKTLTTEQFKKELYRLACNVSISANVGSTVITVSGLSENMPHAVRLCEQWINGANVDEEAYTKMVDNELKARADAKLSQQTCFRALRDWVRYGSLNPTTNIMSTEELRNANPQSLLDKIADLKNYQQTIVYYGPLSEKEIVRFIEKNHSVASHPAATSTGDVFQHQPINDSAVYIAPYDAKNIYMMMISNNGEKYDPENVASESLFNEYFGGGMNTIVFQELREARGLAYSASAYYVDAAYKGQDNNFYTYIISQNDKMMDCVAVFNDIIENMPVSASAFQLAKDALLKRLATERTIKSGVLSSYLDARNHGLDYDINKVIYDKVSAMTLDDVVKFQQNHLKNRKYHYAVLGNEAELDMESLGKKGGIQRLTLEQIFGY